jgi:hypothetical protein
MNATTKAMLTRMPLAESVLWLWRLVTSEERMQPLWDTHRGRCYQKIISFTTIVQLIADALLQYSGSGRRSFEKSKEQGELTASVQAAYRKLGRLPVELSEAFLSDSAVTLREMFPRHARRKLPRSLRRFQLITLDGKTIKNVAKRILKLRNVSGGLLGGRALVALEWATGLAVAMRANPDGDANEVPMVRELVPRVREIIRGIRLWLVDRAFCDLTQPARFKEDGDHYLVRYHPKVKFYPDLKRPVRKVKDDQGRICTEQWGWLGGPQDPRRQEVRVIRLCKVVDEGKKDLVLVTDLLDHEEYPAQDLLTVYAERWGIEKMFQQVTEVFGLQRLIGGLPQACIFQFSFCLLLYNLIQVIRAYVAEAQQRPVEELSSEKLFDDVKRELIAWNVMIDAECTLDHFAYLPNTETLRAKLENLLASPWSDTWIKSPKPTKPRSQCETKSKRTHSSVYRILHGCHRRRKPKVLNSS